MHGLIVRAAVRKTRSGATPVGITARPSFNAGRRLGSGIVAATAVFLIELVRLIGSRSDPSAYHRATGAR